MKGKRSSKLDRHKSIEQMLADNPFLTDEELAKLNKISIQTIRLDRMELGIPELRERVRNVATNNYNQLKSIDNKDLVGELLEVNLDKSGLSLLNVNQDMVLSKTGIVRGHHLFAQANTLAIAIVNSEVALTGGAEVKFLRPVKLKEKVICHGTVEKKLGDKYIVKAVSKVMSEEVLIGKFIVFARGKGGVT